MYKNNNKILISSQVLKDYFENSLSVIPTDPKTKKTTLTTWKPYQSEIMSQDQAAKIKWPGLSVVAGKVSGNLEVIDFDYKAELFGAWAGIVEEEAPGLGPRLLQQKTQNNGRHIIYRCPGTEILGNKKLASGKIEVKRSGEHEYQGKLHTAYQEGGKYYISPCYIETRGEGGYFLAAPTPGYEIILGSFDEIPEITPQEREVLIRAAKALDRNVKPKRDATAGVNGGDRPGDIYNEMADVSALLIKHGWTKAGCRDGFEHYTRPGKKRGVSASLIGGKIFNVFTSNAPPLEPDTAYKPFSLYTILEHNGDFEAAARALVQQGYNTSSESNQAGTSSNTGKYTGWEKPVPLKKDRAPDLPPNILTGIIGDMAKAVSVETETPLELAVGLILSVLGTACQRKFVVKIKEGYKEPVNIWVVVALGPANRKSSVLIKTTKPLNKWEVQKHSELEPMIKDASSKLRNQEARIKHLRTLYGKEKNREKTKEIEAEIQDIENNLVQVPTYPKIWAQDVTPEHLGTLLNNHAEKMSILSAEGGIFDILGGRYSNGVANLDLFLQGHAGEPVRVDRGSREPVFLDNPALTLGLSPQPEVLRELAGKPGFRGKGLLARFLYLLPKSNLGYRGLESDPVPEDIKNSYHNLIYELLNIEPDENEFGKYQPYILNLSKEAYREWADFYMVVEKDLREGGRFEYIQDWAGKLPGAAARIAGLLHCAKNPYEPWELKIDLETMSTALEIVAALSDHALIAFDLMGADQSLEYARKIWRWVERGRLEVFTKRDCFNALQGTFHKVANMEEPLSVLQEHNYIQEVKKETGGRPSVEYNVNPEFFKSWK